jgi:nitrite reductase (NO-forming)
MGWSAVPPLCSLAAMTEPRNHKGPKVLAALTCVAVAFAAGAVAHAHGDHGLGPPVASGHMGHAAPAPALAFEHYARPDPQLPAIPAGKVKRFRVEVYEHVTRVSRDAPARSVWSYAVNGRFQRGTGLSAPMVVRQGDRVQMTFVNGGSKAMHVTHGHSLDLHAASVAPGKAFATIAPGEHLRVRFVASHPGTFLYHCATGPMIQHLGAGMVGMLLVKPRHLPRVDKELWLMQQEFYPTKAGADPGMAAMMAKQPDVVAFNGYADQYTRHPIHVHSGRRIRVYLLDAGPSLPMLFHVIGAIFTTTKIEGQVGHDAQTVNLGPSQGGYVEFTLAHRGAYPFVNHSFADMMRGAMGAFVTEGVPDSAAAAF